MGLIIIVIGAQGSGKTNFCVRSAWKDHCIQKRIISNVHLKFPYENLKFDDMINTRLDNGSVIIDEAALFGFNSRQSMSKKNIELCSNWLLQIRKKKLNAVFTVQQLHVLDRRLRDNADYYVYCQKFAVLDGKLCKIPQSVEYDKNIPMLIECEVLDLQTEKTAVLRFKANDFYDLYDTSEIIEEQHYESETKKKDKKSKNSK
jgi:hypothetical protein